MATIIGTTGNETLNGTGDADTILAFGGQDQILAGNGDDFIWSVQAAATALMAGPVSTR